MSTWRLGPLIAAILTVAASPTPVRADADAAVDAVLARPLFAFDRRPVPDAPTAPVAATPQPAAITPPSLTVVGILITDVRRSAMIRTGGPRAEMIEEGREVADGWRLATVAPNALTLDHPSGQEVQVPLRAGKGRIAAVTAPEISGDAESARRQRHAHRMQALADSRGGTLEPPPPPPDPNERPIRRYLDEEATSY